MIAVLATLLVLVAAVLGLALALAGTARRVYNDYRRAGGSVLRFEPAAKASDPPGRGALILSTEELFFERYFPPARHSIPLHALLGIETPPRASGGAASAGADLLVIYRTDAGERREERFVVRDAEAWVEMVRRIAGPCPSLRTLPS